MDSEITPAVDPVAPARVLSLGSLNCSPPLFLAPMAGLSHTALRRLILELGPVGCLFTEMLSAKTLTVGENPERSPFLKRTPEEKPLCYQLLASEPEETARAVKIVERLGADMVDINLGCPAPLIRRRGAGSKLMETPDRAAGVVAAARSATALPLSAKIRLGEKLDERALIDFVRMLEGEGVDLIHVHARLRGEPYGRKPRWEWISKVKEAVGVPVIANGSIFSVEDARACLKASNADGLMIGRGAPTTPWLFARIAREIYGVGQGCEAPDLPGVYKRFVELLEESFSPERRLGRLKEFTHYYAANYKFGHTLVTKVQGATTMEAAVKRAEKFFIRADKEFTGWA